MNLPGVVVDYLYYKRKIQAPGRSCLQAACGLAGFAQQSADDVAPSGRPFRRRRQRVKIISKIENQEGLENFESICRETDAVMVAEVTSAWRSRRTVFEREEDDPDLQRPGKPSLSRRRCSSP